MNLINDNFNISMTFSYTWKHSIVSKFISMKPSEPFAIVTHILSSFMLLIYNFELFMHEMLNYILCIGFFEDKAGKIG